MEVQMYGRRASEFLSDESGATVIEYALIAALVSMAAVGVLQSFGNSLITNYTTFSNAMNNAVGVAGG
jgi:pilus assembly protein Flp/PilA